MQLCVVGVSTAASQQDGQGSNPACGLSEWSLYVLTWSFLQLPPTSQRHVH